MSKEAMKLALEVKQSMEGVLESVNALVAENKALKEALAKQEQGEQDTLAHREAASLAQWLFKKHFAHEEHYASGQVVWGLCDTTAGVISQIDNMVCKLVREQEQGEPVAWLYPEGLEALQAGKCWTAYPTKHDSCTIPLSLCTPQQRTWARLTDEEAQWLYDNCRTPSNLIDMTEAKLKEKNT